MSSPLVVADAYARAALARAGDVTALRETLVELRRRLADVESGPQWLLRRVLNHLAIVAVLAVASAASAFIDLVWLRVLVMVAAIPLPLLVPRRMPGRRATGPVPEGTLPELLDGLVAAVWGWDLHLRACAARAWSLGHGGLETTSGEPPFVARQPEASRFEAHQLRRTLTGAHELLHAETAADPVALHRFARHDHVHRRLASASALLRGGVPADRVRWTAGIALVLAIVYAPIPVMTLSWPWWRLPLLAAAMTPVSLRIAWLGQDRRPRTLAWTVPQLRTAIERHLTDVIRLPGEPAARAAADLAAARDLLDHP
ncbi:hypothetical protein [Phytomonospora endophytica]|uniref:Uncharacterized protein n=1 Tax=Phytomonospora endophytica TaxID=714109 RepID=A0A841G2F7_9ACTN|nr:hypothetical protein [Phytomonospora endophytica]MBB6039827.1 hypothetical protein [Phytomonospora endophytica]GIG70319.1 hypothetical protein Pen01_66140 [Phytomonospora endophytica]